MKTHSCRNCGDEFTGRYCPRCGQRNDIGRLSWKALFEGFMSIIFGKDYNGEKGDVPRYGLFGTFWRILFHPATTVSEYIAGKRVRYFSPIGMLFLLSALCVLISHWIGAESMENLMNLDMSKPTDRILKTANEYMNAHPASVYLAMTPFSALAYKWFYAKISGLKYVEYFYIGIFTSIISLALVGLGAVLTFPFHFAEGTTAFYLLSGLLGGIRILIIGLIEAAILRSLLGISWTRAIFSTIAGNTIGYILLVLVGSISLILASRL